MSTRATPDPTPLSSTAYERLDTTLKGIQLLAFATLMLRNLAKTIN
jgi:hypothetical protein